VTTPEGASGKRTRPERWSQRHPGRAAIVYGAAYLALALGGWAAASVLRAPIAIAALSTVIGIATLALSLLLVLAVCRLRMSAAAEAAWMLALAAVFALARPVVFAIVGRWIGAPGAGERLARTLTILPGQELVGNAALILWAILLGRLVSRIIREGKLLFPVAVVAAVVDVFTVFRGVVARVSEKAPEVVKTFTASTPVPPPSGVAVPILGGIGIGDFLFFSLLISVMLRYAMNATGSLWGTFVATLVAPVAFMIWPNLGGIPGLPFIAVAVILANWRHLEFSRAEKKALAVAALVLAALVALFWVALSR